MTTMITNRNSRLHYQRFLPTTQFPPFRFLFYVSLLPVPSYPTPLSPHCAKCPNPENNRTVLSVRPIKYSKSSSQHETKATYPTFRSDGLGLSRQSFADRLAAPETKPDDWVRHGENGQRDNVVDQQQSHVVTTPNDRTSITFSWYLTVGNANNFRRT